jgi:hypothetical protein
MANTSHGTCMYLEFRKDSTTAQIVIVPEHAREGSASAGPAPAVLMHRRQDISKAQRRQRWDFETIVAPNLDARAVNPVTGLIRKGESLQVAMQEASVMYRQIAPFIESLFSSGFQLYKAPLLMEIGPAEIQALDSGNRPDGLLRRIDRCRKDAGFSAELWEERYMY